MKRKRTLWMPLIVTLILSTLAVGMQPVQASTPAGTLALSPETIYVEKDNETVTLPYWPYFSVNVTITNVTGIVGAVFSIHWDPTILNFTSIVGCPPFPISGYPDYLLPAGGGGISGLMYTVDYAGGNLKQAAQVQLFPFSAKTYTDPDWGWVANLTLEFIGTPPSSGSINTNITIVDNPGALMATEWTPDGVAWNKFETLGTCEFTYAGPPAVGGDAAVINVLPATNQTFPTWIPPLNITVTVLNNDTDPISFNVTVYYDATEIGTQTVNNLAGGAEMNRTFSWNLTGVAYGLYDIKAVATLEDDVNPANDEFVAYDAVKVKIPGDVDGDGSVGGGDLGSLGWAWGTTPGMPKYNPQSDFDQDGSIGGGDLGLLGWNWGKSVTY